MQSREIIENLERKDVIFKTPKIQFKSRIYPSNYLKDLLESYNKLFSPVSFSTFYSALKNFSTNGIIKIQNVNYEIFENNENLEKSIISKKTGIQIPYEEILNNSDGFFKSPYQNDSVKLDVKNVKELVNNSIKNIKVSPDKKSDINDSSFEIGKSPSKKYMIVDSDSDSEIVKGYNSSVAQMSKSTNNGYNILGESDSEDINIYKPYASKNIFDDDDSSDIFIKKEENFEKIFDQKMNINDTFEKIKSDISRAFLTSAAISTDTFNAAYCKVNGTMFNYKVARCGMHHKSHPSLSNFLRCCSSVVEIRDLKKQYIINKDLTIPKKRFDYFSKITKGHSLFKLAIESLCCNLFPTKCTIFLDDFLNLFEFIYNMSFSNYLRLITNSEFDNKKIIDYINNLRIPNFIISQKNYIYSLIITPSMSEDYREWESELLHKKMREIENGFVSKIVVKDADVNKITANIFKPSSEHLDMLKMADLNVPKCVLKEVTNKYFNDENVKFNDFWIYIKENVNFDGKRVFFN